MDLVARGLGQPQSGPLVAAGLGYSGTATTITAAMRATLSGSSQFSATASGAVVPVDMVATLSGTSQFSAGIGGPAVIGGSARYWLAPAHPFRPWIIHAPMVATLSGHGTVTGHLDWRLDTDALLAQLIAFDLV